MQKNDKKPANTEALRHPDHDQSSFKEAFQHEKFKNVIFLKAACLGSQTTFLFQLSPLPLLFLLCCAVLQLLSWGGQSRHKTKTTHHVTLC